MRKVAPVSKSPATWGVPLTHIGSTPVAIVASAIMLSWVAFYNGAPLVFSDTIAYATAALEGEVPGVFSIYYSLFILPLHQGRTLWPVVLVQGAMLGHLLYLVTRCVSGGRASNFDFLLIVVVLCLFSSLPWITGQIMPDVFSPVVLLNIFLLAFCKDQLSPRELVYVGALTAAAIATHFSHMPLAIGFILLCLGLRLILASEAVRISEFAVLLLAPLFVAVAAMLTVNWVNSRQLVFARNSNVFLLAKLIDEGPALSHLDQACAEARYLLCAHLEDLRGLTHDDLKWGPNSPFNKVGSFDELEPEARRIVWATVRAYPLVIIRRAVTDSGRQLIRFEAGDGLTPAFAKMVGGYLGDVFGPEIETSLIQSKQGQGRLPIAEFRLLHRFGLIFSSAYCLWSFVLGRKQISKKLLALYIFVPGAVVCSAIVTGALAGPYDRYLARVIWIIVFIGLLGYVCRLRGVVSETSARSEPRYLVRHLR